MLPTRTAVALQDRGATAVEYAILVGLIAAVIIVAVGVLGLNVLGLFTSASLGW